MSKKKLQNRLDSLFADLEEDTAYLPSNTMLPGLDQSLPGWTWQCDERGCFTACSPEVSDYLGVQPDEMIGQTIAGFLLENESSQVLKTALENEDDQFPVEVSLKYRLPATGELLDVSVHIFQAQTAGAQKQGWHGFTQIVNPPAAENIPEPPSDTPAVPPKPSGGIPTRPIPAPSWPRNGSGKAQNIGFLAQDHGILPAKNILTPVGEESLLERRTIARDSDHPEEAGVLAFSTPLRSQNSDLLLEILNEGSPRHWSEDDRILVEQVADQLSLALENARLFQETQAALTDTETLYSITSAANQSLELKETLQQMLIQVLDATEFEIGLVSTVDESTGKLTLSVHQNLPEHFLNRLSEDNGLDGTLCALVYEMGKPLSIEDLGRDSPIDASGLVSMGFHSYLGVPLESKGKILGTLCTFSYTSQPEHRQNISLMQAAGQQIGIAIENARLFQQTQERAEEMSILRDVSLELAEEQRDLNSVLEIITRRAMELLDADGGGVWLWRDQTQDLELVISHQVAQTRMVGRRLKPGEGLTGRAISERKTLLVEDYLTWQGSSEIFQDAPFHAALAVPLNWQNQVVGALVTTRSRLGHHFTPNEQHLAELLGGQAAAVIQNARLFEQTQQVLTETEALYQASAELNSSSKYGDILKVLRQYTVLGHPNVSDVIISLFDKAWVGEDRPRWYTPITRWSAVQYQEALSNRYQIRDWTTLDLQFHPDYPTLIEDVASDARLNDSARTIYIDHLNASSLILVPLNVAGRWIGLISAIFNQGTTFSDPEIRRLLSLSGQASVAIQNLNNVELARQRAQEAQQRSEELALVNRVVSSVAASLDLQVSLDIVASELGQALSVQTGIALYNEERQLLTVIANYSPNENAPDATGIELPLEGNPSSQQVLRTRKTLIIEDPQNSPLTVGIHDVMKDRGIESLMIIPLVSGNQVIGTVGLDILEKGRKFTDDEIRLSETIVLQASTAIQNARLFDQTQQALLETETLYQASAELNAAKSYTDILLTLRRHTLLGKVVKLLSLNLFNRPWIDNMIPDWSYPLARITDLPEESLSKRYPIRNYSTANLLSSTEPTIIVDVHTDPRLEDEIRQLYIDVFYAQSVLFVPLVVAGRWIGYINAVFTTPTQFPEDEIRRLMALANQAAVAVQNLQSIDLAEKRAQEAQQRSSELELVNRVVTAVAASLDLRDALQIVAQETVQALPVHRAGIALLNEERTALTVMADYSTVADVPSGVGVVIPLKDNLSSQRVLETRKPLIITKAQESPLTEPIHEALSQRGIETLAIFPLIVGSTVIGTIGFDILEKERTLTEPETRLAESIVLQSATAIQNARLFEQTQQALTETEVLYNASAELNAAKNYDDILTILRRYSILGNIDKNTSLNLFDQVWREDQQPEWVIPIARWGKLPDSAVSTRYALNSFPGASKYLRADVPTAIEDVLRDERMDENSRNLYQHRFEAGSTIFIPLVVGGQWIGFINGIYGAPRIFTSSETRRLMALANQAAVAIQNIRLLEESRRRANQLQTAAEIARDTSSTLALDNLLNRTANLLCDRFGYYHASIFLLDESGEYALIRESTGEAGEEMKRQGHKLEVGSQSVIGHVTAEGEPLVVNDVIRNPIHRPNPLLPQTRAELGMPLKIGQRIIGALDVQSTQVDAFTPDDISVLQILADQIAVAVDNARSYEVAQEAVEEMREVDRLKSQFLANMSHELRTPLNSIIGFSRVIIKGIDGPINDVQEQDLNAIYSSGQHLLGLINDVLDLSKIEAGKMELAFENAVNLNDLINSVMSTVIGLLKDKPIDLKKDIDPNLPTVRADPMKVRQILINLFSNAAKFTEEGSITVRAKTETGPDGNSEIVISVIDTGPGIASEDQNKLFQPFSQVDGSLTRKTGGSGLGLSICRHLVEMHGGRIDLESELGVGTRFYFTLPIQITQQTVLMNEDSRLVLAIDDDRQVISLYERYLSNHGYQVLALTDPFRAVEQAEALQPYAITLDVMMPGRDGWQVLYDLKKNPATQNIPVIICSILENREKGFSLGAADYLAKPILEEELVRAVNRLNNSAEIQDILVVDDNPEDLQFIEKTFAAQERYQLRLAENGSQALVDIRFKRPDMIIMALFMKDLDGFTLLETLKADPAWSEIPVIVLTSKELDTEQQMRLDEFSQTMLKKNALEGSELLASIEQVLSRIVGNKAPPFENEELNTGKLEIDHNLEGPDIPALQADDA
jgi:GAF domain-containing protein/DNA-binding response OmpR family regulator/two-component sensor histidine kinase